MAWDPDVAGAQATLRARVLTLYGLDTADTDLQTLAEQFLDETVTDMNSQLYEFNKKTEGSIAMVEGQRETAALNDAFYRESAAYLVKTSDGAKQDPLIYIPYTRFIQMYNNDTYTGKDLPYAYSCRNVEGDGLVSLAPSPSATAASDYTLTVEYYRRIPRPSDAGWPTSVPPEVETPLVYGAQKRLAIHIQGPGHPDVVALDSLERRSLQQLLAVDKRHPDQQKRFVLVDHRRRPPNWRAGRLIID